MRKKALKKKYPNRGFLIKQNRENFQLRDYTYSNGAVTQLNFVKHFLFNKPYINEEYKKDFFRYTNELYKRIMDRKKDESDKDSES